jgi:RNA polymerase sigma factor (sigma-70 family)
MTHWTQVLAAAQGDPMAAAPALEQLCRKYWYPIYVYVRQRSAGSHEAEDLTQGFFEHLLRDEVLKGVDRERGMFRHFLLAVLRNFLANDYHRQRTYKRGKAYVIISLEELHAEQLYAREPADTAGPENGFQRRWAWVLIKQAMTRLQAEYTAQGKQELYSQLEPGLTGETPPGGLAQLALALDMSEGAVKVALHRLRRRFRELLRAEIEQTVARKEDVTEELRHLSTALAAGQPSP